MSFTVSGRRATLVPSKFCVYFCFLGWPTSSIHAGTIKALEFSRDMETIGDVRIWRAIYFKESAHMIVSWQGCSPQGGAGGGLGQGRPVDARVVEGTEVLVSTVALFGEVSADGAVRFVCEQAKIGQFKM